MTKSVAKTKQAGQVFTPAEIVSKMIDDSGLNSEALLSSKIMEPSCGDGAFIIELLKRMIAFAKSTNRISDLYNAIGNNLFGIEKDPVAFLALKKKVLKLFEDERLECGFPQNIILGDTLALQEEYRGKMDFVIGNPPYVRVHNMNRETAEQLSRLKFCKGTTDLYVAFFEIGINMLNETGTLCFITPNSFLLNASQKAFRKEIAEKRLVTRIYDFKAKTVFPDASVYTSITTLKKGVSNESFSFLSLGGDGKENVTKVLFNSVLGSKDFILHPATPTLSAAGNAIGDVVQIRYGVSTNLDKVYIGKTYEDASKTVPYLGKHCDKRKIVYFNGFKIESDILRRCAKSSRYNGELDETHILFPYIYKEGKCIALDERALREQYPLAHQYLLHNRDALEARDMDNGAEWFEFARSQGLNYMNEEKATIKNFVLESAEQIQCHLLPADVVVYGGVFMAGEGKYMPEAIEALKRKENARLCISLGSPKQRDYVLIPAKVLSSAKLN